jgi:hypothetical protein
MEQERNDNSNKKQQKPKFKEPKIKWGNSQARELLYSDLREGRIPSDAKDANGQSTMQLREIYVMRSEYAEYAYQKFSSRLSTLRKILKKNNGRAEADQAAFDQYKSNHEISYFSHKGYIQWQGSDAQEFLLQDLEEGLHNVMRKKELWLSRPEYHTTFPLAAFRDFVYQEIRTAKYLHTLRVKGKLHKAS